MRKSILLLFSLVAIAITLNAVPAPKGAIKVTQPDGSTIEVLQHGDELFHFTTTTDGLLIARNSQGVLEYAREDAEGNIILSGVKAHSLSERTISDQLGVSNASKGLRPTTIEKCRMESPLFRTPTEIAEQGIMTKVSKTPNATLSQQGTISNEGGEAPIQKAAGKVNLKATKGLVILVNFSDKTFKSTNTRADFDSLCNGRNYTYNGATGSTWRYFMDQSNGAFNPTFDVVGPVTISYKSTNWGTGTSNIPNFYKAAIDAADNAGVDFTKYDTDNDGTVDFVFFYYAGLNAAEVGTSNGYIWPHSSSMASANITKDGKKMGLYACTSELNGSSQRAGIGTFTHEFNHVLGMADHYDTQYSTNYNNGVTPGDWDVMDQGSYNNSGKTPPNYSAFEKYYFGWAQPTVLYNAENVTLPADGKTYKAYNGNSTCPAVTNTSNVWYFENRQKIGWDKYVPGHGMLVWKVQYSASVWQSNAPNNTAGSPRCTIVPADGKTSSYGTSSDPFPGSGSVKTFTPNSSATADVATDIAESNSVVTFKWKGGCQCVVTFNTQSRGTCAVTSLTEASAGAGVTLPNVTANTGYTFQGWARSASATTPDARAGETFYAGKSCTLYAVYSSANDVLVAYNLTGAEQLSGTAAGYLTKGSALSASFKAATGYQDLNAENTAVSVKVGDTEVNANPTFSNGVLSLSLTGAQVTNNITVDVTAMEKFTITNLIYGYDSIGWVSNEEGLFNYGDEFSFEIIPDDGYFISPAIKRSICITMGGDTLNLGEGFTYDYDNNIVTIPFITGNLTIVAIAQPLQSSVSCSDISATFSSTIASGISDKTEPPYVQGTITLDGHEFFVYAAYYNSSSRTPSVAYTASNGLAFSNAYMVALVPLNAHMCCLKSVSINAKAGVANNVAFYVNRYDTDYWDWDESNFGSRGSLTKYWDSQAYYSSTGKGENKYTTSDYLLSRTSFTTLSVECGTSYDSSDRLHNVNPYILLVSGAISGTTQNTTIYLKSLNITFDESACRVGTEKLNMDDESDIKIISEKRAVRVENIPEGSDVYVLDMAGAILRTKEAAASVQEFALPQGAYMIQVINGDNIRTFKTIAK